MQRILFVTDSLMAGGVERQLTELVTRLDRTRFEPVVVSLYGDRSGLRPHFSAQIQAMDIPLYILDLGWRATDKLAGLVKLLQLTRRLQPDIVQAFNYHSNLLLRLARPFFPRKTPLIGSVRGNYTPKQLLYERISQWTCFYIATNGPHLRQQLIDKAHIPSRKIIYIPNGVDVDYFAHFQDSTARDRIAPGAGRVFVSIGRISHEKRMHYLPEALGLLKNAGRLPGDLRLFIIGASDNSAMQQLLDESIARHALEATVKYCPETHDLAPYYYACDATILFSPAEGMPNVVLESLAASRPVVVSEGANLAGIIEHEKTGWIVPTGDIEQLAQALHRVIICSSDTLETMNANCLQRATDFSMSNMVAAYERLYERFD